MCVFDCFMFNDELDLFEFWFMEFDFVVDVFVICELLIIFMCKLKLLYFYENLGWFEWWIHKVWLLYLLEYLIGSYLEIEVF